MTEAPRAKTVPRWLIVYVVVCILGTLLLMNYDQTGALASWNWWQRLLLVVLVSPAVTVAYVLWFGFIEVLLRGLWYLFRESPLAALVILSVVGAVGSVAWSFVGP